MRFLLTLLLAFLILWLGAFGIYLGSMSLPAAKPQQKVDALIVLTGGNARVERGFELLAAGDADVLFISGVGKDVTLAEMLQAHTKPAIRQMILQNQPDIVFDYHASSTRTNATEAATFVKERGYHSVRLITGHYHMPRSLVEFRAALPGVTILRDPVVPEIFVQHKWWEYAATRTLVLQEFHKYLAASFRVLTGKD
jgi:uncharacterized SAM-binding protein YcdF (DUF218 family)